MDERTCGQGRSAYARGLALLAAMLLVAGCGGGSAPTPTPIPSQLTATPTAIAPTASAPTTPSPTTQKSSPPAATPALTPTPSPLATASPPPPACPVPPVYVIRAGDTLWDIAKRHGLSVDALLVANPQVVDRRAIRVGDQITISPIDLGTLGGDSSRATAINRRGQVVGTSDTASDQRHAFLWQDGSMTDLGTLGGGSSEAIAINDDGQVVGWSGTASQERHAFVWQDGSMTDLGTLGGGSSEATAINERGQVVGWSEIISSGGDLTPRHAFLWQDGAMTDLGTLGGGSSEAVAINGRGQVAGWSEIASTGDASGRRHAFLWQGGAMTDLGPAAEGFGAAVAINAGGQVSIVGAGGTVVSINDRGQIAGGRHLSDMVFSGDIYLWQDGRTTDLGPLEEAFSWQDGKMTALGSLGHGATTPVAVNGRGQVVGSSLTEFPALHPGEWCCSTLFHAFLWQNGSMTDLGDLGGLASRTSSGATAINDCGQVVGWSSLTPEEGAAHAALWYTGPE